MTTANEDPFAALANLQKEKQPPATSAASARGPVPAATEKVVHVDTAHDERAPERKSGRDSQLAAYIDDELDAFIEEYASRRVAGTRRKPSRSLVGYWMLTIAKRYLEENEMPAMPTEVLRRRRR
jgi:hypothetical protein